MMEVAHGRSSLIAAQVHHVAAKIRIATERRSTAFVRHPIHDEVLVVAHHHALMKQSAAKPWRKFNILQPRSVCLILDCGILDRHPSKAR